MICNDASLYLHPCVVLSSWTWTSYLSNRMWQKWQDTAGLGALGLSFKKHRQHLNYSEMKESWRNQIRSFNFLSSQFLICKVRLMIPRVVVKLKQISEVKVWQLGSSTIVVSSSLFSLCFPFLLISFPCPEEKQSKKCFRNLNRPVSSSSIIIHALLFTHLCVPQFSHL